MSLDRLQPLDLAHIAEMLTAMRNEMGARLARLETQVANEKEFRRVLLLLAAQHGDPTHATVETAAKIKGVSVRTIRRRIAEGELRLETVPGQRASGIPIEQLYDDWQPLAVARAAREREREER